MKLISVLVMLALLAGAIPLPAHAQKEGYGYQEEDGQYESIEGYPSEEELAVGEMYPEGPGYGEDEAPGYWEAEGTEEEQR